MKNKVTYVDFVKKEVKNISPQPPSVFYWKCNFCQGTYPYTEGSSTNMPKIIGGTERYQAVICKECICIAYDLLSDKDDGDNYDEQ